MSETPTNGHVDAASDTRVLSNVMRHQYRALTTDEKVVMGDIKNLGAKMYEYIEGIGSSRELSLAKTKIEEAVFWAVKHVTK